MKIYPVIHHRDRHTTLLQAQLALDAGADGVFLISHAGGNDGLPGLAQEVQAQSSAQHTDFRVGINLLGAHSTHALQIALEHELDMLWCDDAGVDGLSANNAALAMANTLRQLNGTFELFGSVAFKYQKHETNPATAARNAAALGFVSTTSGAGTGEPPAVDKIIGMSLATSGQLAVASGMTPDNIAQYAPLLSHVLVATGVSADEHHFDFEKLVVFIARARAAARV